MEGGKGGRGRAGGGVGWGLVKEPASQCARVCQDYPLANYPLVCLPKFRNNMEVSHCFREGTESRCFQRDSHIRARSKEALRLPGATWDRFRCTVEPSPGHIGCGVTHTICQMYLSRHDFE